MTGGSQQKTRTLTTPRHLAIWKALSAPSVSKVSPAVTLKLPALNNNIILYAHGYIESVIPMTADRKKNRYKISENIV